MKTAAKAILTLIFASFATAAIYASMAYVGAEMNKREVIAIALIGIAIGILVNIPIIKKK